MELFLISEFLTDWRTWRTSGMDPTPECLDTFARSCTAHCCCRQLKGTAHEGLLVLAVQQAGASDGTRGGLRIIGCPIHGQATCGHILVCSNFQRRGTLMVLAFRGSFPVGERLSSSMCLNMLTVSKVPSAYYNSCTTEVRRVSRSSFWFAFQWGMEKVRKVPCLAETENASRSLRAPAEPSAWPSSSEYPRHISLVNTYHAIVFFSHLFFVCNFCSKLS